MKEHKYKMVIFDVDGTILDTSQGLLESTKYMIQKLGYDMPSEKILLSFIGPRIQDSLCRVFGLNGNELEQAASIFRKRYKEQDVLNAKPYDGIYGILGNLMRRGFHVAVATNKRQDFTDALLAKFGFDEYIERAFGTDMEGKLRKEDLILMCLDFFGICNSKEVIMVGDSSYDAIAAHRTGVDFVGVTYGFEFRTKKDVDKYEHIGIAESVSELADICRGL